MSKVSSLSRNRQERRKSRVIDPALVMPHLEDQLAHLEAGRLRRLPNALGQAALLEWLGQSPIAFHRVYVDLTGGVLPALWLSHAMDRVSRANAASFEPNGDFVFAMSAHECELATGITRAQQTSCRKQLVELGLLSQRQLAGGQRAVSLGLEVGLVNLKQRLHGRNVQAAGTHDQLRGAHRVVVEGHVTHLVVQTPGQ